MVPDVKRQLVDIRAPAELLLINLDHVAFLHLERSWRIFPIDPSSIKHEA